MNQNTISTIAAVIIVNIALGILFAVAWALFVTPVFDVPRLEPLEIIGATIGLFVIRFYLSPRNSNVNINMGGGNPFGDLLKNLPKTKIPKDSL